MKFCGFIRASSLEWKALLLLSVITSPAFAQQAAVSLSSGSSVPGGAVTLSISLASTGGAQPAAVQWTMGYSASSVTSVSVIAGSSLTAAGKSVTCSPYATGTICVAYGMNANTISNGILATATFQIAPGTLVTSVPVQMTAVSASTPPGVPIAGAGTGGTISITQPVSPAVSGLTCVPATVTAPGSAACTVTLSSPALSGGFSIALSSQNSAATVPSTVNVAAGASSATFTATVSSVSTNQTATLSAVGGGATKTFNLSIAPGQWSISGGASAQGSGATITLSGAKSATTTADGSGNFTFTSIVNGTYTIAPSKTGYAFAPSSKSVTVNGTNVTGVTFTATQNQTTSSIAPDVGIWRDRSSAKATITSPSFSTKSGSELLLAFISASDVSQPNTTVKSVSGGGLTWVLAVRTNRQNGTAEIWRAFATSPLSNVSVTASLSQKVAASLGVMSFTGTDTTGTSGSGAIGATASNSASSGAPTAKLTTTRNNSWVFGVGNDYGEAIARTPSAGQTVIHQYLAAAGNTFWVQSQVASTASAGTSVVLSDTAPTSDRYNLSVVEILPAASVSGQTRQSQVLEIMSSLALPGTLPGNPVESKTSGVSGTLSVLSMSNTASGLPGNSCSPGGLATLSGSGFTTQAPQSAASIPVPTTLAGVQVTVNGHVAPLMMVSSAQVNFQCPVLPSGSPLTITLQAENSSEYSLQSVMQAASPGLFSMDTTRQGLITIAGTNEIAMPKNNGVPGRPASRGEILTIFVSGLGQTLDNIPPGTMAPHDRWVPLSNTIKIVVGGLEIDPLFSGLAPGTVGLYQVNAKLPPGVPAGAAVPTAIHVILADGTVVESNTVTVAISD